MRYYIIMGLLSALSAHMQSKDTDATTAEKAIIILFVFVAWPVFILLAFYYYFKNQLAVRKYLKATKKIKAAEKKMEVLKNEKADSDHFDYNAGDLTCIKHKLCH